MNIERTALKLDVFQEQGLTQKTEYKRFKNIPRLCHHDVSWFLETAKMFHLNLDI